MCDTSMLEEKAMVQFLNRFTDYPFLVRWEGHEDRIGHGNPIFAVNIKDSIPVKELTDSTSLALGEAYMKGRLDVEGICMRRWTISLDRWTGLPLTRPG